MFEYLFDEYSYGIVSALGIGSQLLEFAWIHSAKKWIFVESLGIEYALDVQASSWGSGPEITLRTNKHLAGHKLDLKW